jgi:acetyltransferase-like isoleucine patch superfamily enzyme
MSSLSVSPTSGEADRDQLAVAKNRFNGGLKLFGIRALNYVTNHMVSHIPSFTLRHIWYQRMLGIQLENGAMVHLGCYIWFYGRRGIRRDGVRIGQNTHINRNCVLDVRGGLTIGSNVSVSADVIILTSAGLATSRSVGEPKRVVIEDNAWIGIRAIVMPGVTIGRGAVVGAGAVVMGDVPTLAIVFGSPARPVGRRPSEEAEYVLDSPRPLFE